MKISDQLFVGEIVTEHGLSLAEADKLFAEMPLIRKTELLHEAARLHGKDSLLEKKVIKDHAAVITLLDLPDCFGAGSIKAVIRGIVHHRDRTS